MRFPRCIRLDSSDLQVFEQAAGPGEWAVPGSFAFAADEPTDWSRKRQLAFRSGWLGTESFGRSSLVEVAEIEEADFFQLIERLAQHFVEAYGAPDLVAALPAAREEADYAASLCDQKLHSLLAIERDFTETESAQDESRIVERIRVIQPERATDHAKIWQIVPEEND